MDVHGGGNENAKRGRGRPRNIFGSRLLKEALQESNDDDSGNAQQPQPGSIEYARHIREQKVLARKSQQNASSSHSSCVGSLSLSEATQESMVQFGSLDIVTVTDVDGRKTYEKLVDALVQCKRKNIEPSDPLVEHQLNDAMCTTSASQLGKQLNETKIGSRMLSIASALLNLSCYLWGAMLCTLKALWSKANSGITPLLCVIKMRYDETPSRVRVLDPQKSSETFDFKSATMEETLLANPLGSKSDSLHAKLMQIELSVGILLYDSEKNLYNFVRGGVPTCLFAIEKTTAKCTVAVLNKALQSVPGLMDFAQSGFKFQLRHACTDRYTSNIAAEKVLQHQYPNLELMHMFCDIHRLYTSTKVAMSTVESDVAGMLAVGLGFAETGSCSAFQQALCRIFSRKMVVYHTQPPTMDVASPAAIYQRDLFDVFLPIRGVEASYAKLNKKRRYIISYLLNGDMRDALEIPHFCRWGCCVTSEATMKCFAVYLSWALCPRQIPIFPRSRWTQYDKCVDALGLLAGVHGLLPQVIFEVTGNPVLAPAPNVSDFPDQNPSLALKDNDEDDWDSALDSENARGQPVPSCGIEPPPPVQGIEQEQPASEEPDWSDYAKIRKQNKAKAALWVATSPFPRLVIIKETFSILLLVMYHFLDVSGKSFERRQRLRAQKGFKRSYTVLEAALGVDVNWHMQELIDLMWRLPKAMPAASYSASLKAKRFTMISCALSSVHCLVRMPRAGFPYRMFKLLVSKNEAEGILQCRPCMYDALSHMLLQEYDSC